MNDIENDQHEKHGKGVEDVKEIFMCQNISVISLNILDDTNNRPGYNEDAGGVQGVHVLPENIVESVKLGGRIFCNTGLKYQGGDHEEREEDDLDEEAAEDDAFAHILRFLVLHEETGAYLIVNNVL